MSRPSRPLEDQALLLRRFRYGESSLVVHFLTRRYGRVSALAKGAYRLKSGFFGVLDLFDTLNVSWKRQESELGVVRSASVLRRRRRMTDQLPRYRTALSILELAGLGARVGVSDPELFDHTEQALDVLVAERSGQQVAPELVRIGFDLGFLDHVGLRPALEQCASCGGPPAEQGGTAPFSVQAGGRLCEGCAADATATGRKIDRLPLQLLGYARSLLRTPIDRLDRIRLEARTRAELSLFVERFVEYHLESRPRAWGRDRLAPRRSGVRSGSMRSNPRETSST